MENKLVLIDGNSILNRAFYGVPDLTNREGLHTNAIYGFLNILFKILDEEEPSHLLVAFDEKAPTFRHKMYEEYKGKRKPMPAELSEQVPVIRNLLQVMNIRIYAEEGIEADDILGTMAKKAEQEGYLVSIVSGDRDLLQLATDTILVRIPKTSRGKTVVEDYHTAQVIEKYSVTPSQIIDLKGLMGDASDNIPGVPGIGEKTAVKILTMFGTVENAIEHVEEVTPNRAKEALKNHVDMAKMSKDLATIRTNCKLGVVLSECTFEDMFNEKAYQMIQSLDLKSILKRFSEDTGRDKKLEKYFQVIETKKDWLSFVQTIEKKEPVAVKAVFRKDAAVTTSASGQMTLFMTEADGRLLGMAVAFSKEKIAFCKVGDDLSEYDITSEISNLLKTHILVANDLKSQLDFLPDAKPENSYDTNLAAYLLSPVQKKFGEEEIAENYASVLMHPYEQFFGKQPEETAFLEKEDEAVRYFSYCALVNVLAYPNLSKELKKQKMQSLFEQIEMPLLFTLYDMEKVGILVEKEALHEYGAKLGERISELEADIYERAGESFNIN